MKYRSIVPALLTAIISATAPGTYAQDATDALRYSYLSPHGTARTMGFGNALGSVGGDIATLNVNPAGIGIYRSSEMMITPVLKLNNTETGYLGNTVTDNNTRFNLNNLGAVFTSTKKGEQYKRSSWKSFSFGLGVNRMADFNRDYSYNGFNSGDKGSSATEVFAYDANMRPSNRDVEGTPAWFGYQSYLIDMIDTVNFLFDTNVPWFDGIRQQRMVKERGGVNEYFFSFGGNYEEVLMLGVTVGIPSIRYRREATYREADERQYSNVFDNFSLTEKLNTSGIGINAKLGMIYKPVDYFRIGASVHTPTAFAMSESYEQSLEANTEGYAQPADYIYLSPINQFNYGLTTPWRGILSATAMMGKMGFFTVDYEYVDYRSARYRFRTDDISWSASYKELEQQINQSIRNAYQAASNIRAGVEVRLSPVMMRAGFGYYGSPYRDFNAGSRMDFSAGLGFRFDQSFIDLGFRHSRFQQQEQPYVLPEDGIYLTEGITAPTATMRQAFNNIALTVGFKF